MEAELSEGDLLAALNTFADSALGPDGIPDSTYKKAQEYCRYSYFEHTETYLQHWAVASTAQ
jgi:hypothetical protein